MNKLPSRAKQNGRFRPDQELTEFEAIEYMAMHGFRMSIHTLRQTRTEKPRMIGPRFLKIDGWHIKYRMRDLEAFVKNRNAKVRVVDPADRLAAAS